MQLTLAVEESHRDSVSSRNKRSDAIVRGIHNNIATEHRLRCNVFRIEEQVCRPSVNNGINTKERDRNQEFLREDGREWLGTQEHHLRLDVPLGMYPDLQRFARRCGKRVSAFAQRVCLECPRAINEDEVVFYEWRQNISRWNVCRCRIPDDIHFQLCPLVDGKRSVQEKYIDY